MSKILKIRQINLIIKLKGKFLNIMVKSAPVVMKVN